MAEYREMYRIRTLLISTLRKRKPVIIQSCFVLGRGHMKYFYDKGDYILNRHKALYIELTEVRGYNIYTPVMDDWPKDYMNGIISDLDIFCAQRMLRRVIRESLLSNRFKPIWTNRKENYEVT